ncbi:Organic cation transporter protein [Exaiptasia diaphana]|nr:Organic cation transporter protein [Exaiptasia diaphana]
MEKQDKNNREVTFDDVFSQIKSFGRYQHCAYWFVAAMKIPMAVQFGFLVFTFGTQKFKCDSSNVTCPINKCCHNCTSYSFDQKYISAVSEWSLICDRAHVTAFMQSSFFWGMLFGSIAGGWVSDRFGRKKCIFGNLFLTACFSLCCAFVNSPIAISILRFCVGFVQSSLMVSQYAFSIEVVGPKKRTFAGIATTLIWKVGGAMNVSLAYFFPYWRHHIIAGSIPGFLFLPFYLIFPESPRWLVAQGRLDEAQIILEKFGGKNNKPVDKQQLRSTLDKVRDAQLANQNVRQKFHMHDLCKTPRLRRFSLVACYNCFGRRISFTGFMFVASIALLILPFIPQDVPQVRTALAIIGKSVMACEFTLIYMRTSELFPTVVRNLSIGVGSMTARFGAILAPFFVMMAQLPGVSMIVPFCIFGVLGISSALLALLLPETLYANMEQTIEAAEEAQLDYSVPCCGKTEGRTKLKRKKNRSTGSTESNKSPEAKKQQVAMADKHEEAISPEEVWKVLMNIQNTTTIILEDNTAIREMSNELKKLAQFNDKRIINLEGERDALKTRVAKMELRIEELTVPQKIEDIADDYEQYLRKYNLEFHGIPESPDFADEETILTIASAIDVDLQPTDIDICHRLDRKNVREEASKYPPRPKPIIVRFSTYKAKQRMYQARKKLGEIDLDAIFGGGVNQLFINENLMTKRRKLLGKARKLKRENVLNYEQGAVMHEHARNRCVITTMGSRIRVE